MATSQKPSEGNRALRMMGLPALPKRLPSRNWLIFWAVATTTSAAIIYDRREKRRATARWARAVSHIAKEPLARPTDMPRRLTIYLESPPGDGFRVAQDHFLEYVKPIIAASGLDWDFVQGRQQGDVRAVVAERVRRARRAVEVDLGGGGGGGSAPPPEPEVPTVEDLIEANRRRNNVREFDGPRGDIVIGRHTWKEYIRGLHEGWLGPLTPPPEPPKIEKVEAADEEGGEASEKKEEEKKPSRPAQLRPHNTPEQYPASPLPMLIPGELTPAAPIRFPHLLGFLNTPIRLRRYFGRRYLADEIGREVAAVCLLTYRDFSDDELRDALAFEERDWVKKVWKENEKKEEDSASPEPPRERIWPSEVVLDTRISSRMRRFELRPDDEARARQIVVPEEEIEGWTKGHLRQLWRWTARTFGGSRSKGPNVGNMDDE
ncbi:hypothetical protein RB601_005554 [Gaeumannomyces tritici]